VDLRGDPGSFVTFAAIRRGAGSRMSELCLTSQLRRGDHANVGLLAPRSSGAVPDGMARPANARRAIFDLPASLAPVAVDAPYEIASVALH